MHAFGRLCTLYMVRLDVEHLYLYPTLHPAVWFGLVSFRFGCGLFYSTPFLFYATSASIRTSWFFS